MESKDALVLTYSRNSFYKQMHYLVLAAFAISVLVIVILIWTLAFLLKNDRIKIVNGTKSTIKVVRERSPTPCFNSAQNIYF